MEHQTYAYAADKSASQFLTFQLGEDEFAFEILSVQEIRGFTEITPLPGSPPFVLGVMNLRGVIVPVVDLRVRFAMPHFDYTRTNVIIVMNDGKRSVGVVVDVVSDVLTFDATGTTESPERDALTSRFVDGISRAGDRLVIRVNSQAVLSLEDNA